MLSHRIIICGGEGVGKTSLFDRLSTTSSTSTASISTDSSSGIREAVIRLSTTKAIQLPHYNYDTNSSSSFYCMSEDSAADRASIVVILVDVPSSLIQFRPDLLSSVLSSCDGVFLCIDSSDIVKSLQTLDVWMAEIKAEMPEDVPKILFANKFDLLANSLQAQSLQSRAQSPGGGNRNSRSNYSNVRSLDGISQLLDAYSNVAGLCGWSFTVARRDLGDIDLKRGPRSLQKRAPEDILLILLRAVVSGQIPVIDHFNGSKALLSPSTLRGNTIVPRIMSSVDVSSLI